MEIDTRRVIILAGSTGASAEVHHRDFPEIRAAAESDLAAAELLAHQLSRALDSALTSWRRESIERAIADVRQFSAQQPVAPAAKSGEA